MNLKADDFPFKNTIDLRDQILIESDLQKTDLVKSIFYAEGNVQITNKNKEFVAKSNKAIFYKSSGIIKLSGNVEVTTNNSNKIKASEILYYLKENNFEAVSDNNQRVYTKFKFN